MVKLGLCCYTHGLQQACAAYGYWMQAFLLAIRLWSKLPADLLSEVSLLPQGITSPPDSFFTKGQGSASAAAAAVFSQQHLQTLLPVLRSTSSSHPRLHSLWPTLLALLLPGFTAVKVANHLALCSVPLHLIVNPIMILLFL